MLNIGEEKGLSAGDAKLATRIVFLVLSLPCIFGLNDK